MSRQGDIKARIDHLKTARSIFIATHGEPETLGPRLSADLAGQTQEIRLLSRALLSGEIRARIIEEVARATRDLDMEIAARFAQAMRRVDREISHFSKLLGKPKVVVLIDGRYSLEDASN